MNGWCVWALLPGYERGNQTLGTGWSQVAAGITQEQAEWMAGALHFSARAMPDREATND